MIKKCLICGNEFEAVSNRVKYCGNQCYLQSKTTAGRHQIELRKNRENLAALRRLLS